MKIRQRYLGELRDKTTERDLEDMARFWHCDYAVESLGDGDTVWLYRVDVV